MIKFTRSGKTVVGFIAGLCAVIFFAVTVTATESSSPADEPQEPVPEYRMTLKKAMDKLFSELESIRKEGIGLEEKQQKAIEFIKVVRYGPEQKDYFWINDMQGKMIMDPYIPDLAGKDLSNFKDQNGKEIFAEFIKVCREKEQGFVDYLWPMYEGKKPAPKISLVRLFKPWGWIIGTGFYLDIIEAYEMPEVIRFYIPLGEHPIEEPKASGT